MASEQKATVEQRHKDAAKELFDRLCIGGLVGEAEQHSYSIPIIAQAIADAEQRGPKPPPGHVITREQLIASLRPCRSFETFEQWIDTIFAEAAAAAERGTDA